MKDHIEVTPEEKVECEIEIQCVTTGEIVTLRNDKYVTDLSVDDGVVNPFIWSDGNYSCDCNRHDFFCEGKGIKPEECRNIDCGNSAYKIRITRLDNREEIYSEV